MTDEQVIQGFLYRREVGESEHFRYDGESLWVYNETDRIAYWDNEYCDLYVQIVHNPLIIPILYNLCYEIGQLDFARPLFFEFLEQEEWNKRKEKMNND